MPATPRPATCSISRRVMPWQFLTFASPILGVAVHLYVEHAAAVAGGSAIAPAYPGGGELRRFLPGASALAAASGAKGRYAVRSTEYAVPSTDYRLRNAADCVLGTPY